MKYLIRVYVLPAPVRPLLLLSISLLVPFFLFPLSILYTDLFSFLLMNLTLPLLSSPSPHKLNHLTALNEKIPSNDVALAAESLKLAKVPVDPALTVFTPTVAHTNQGTTDSTIETIFPKDGKSFASDTASESILLSIRKDNKVTPDKNEITAVAAVAVKTNEKVQGKDKVKEEKKIEKVEKSDKVEKESKTNGVKKEMNGSTAAVVDTNTKKKETPTTPKVVTPLPVATAKPTATPAKVTPRTPRVATVTPAKAVAPPANVLVRPANLAVNTAAAPATASAWGGWGTVPKNVPSPKKDTVSKLLAHKGHDEASDHAGKKSVICILC